jgi:hypothetical protein
MSKSPAGSPTSESAPKSKDSSHRPSLSNGSNSNRSKRAKNEDVDLSLEEIHKNGVSGTTNGRSKRKGKEKDKTTITTDAPLDEGSTTVEDAPEEGELQEEEEEEQGITRCICQEAGESRGFVASHAWLDSALLRLQA